LSRSALPLSARRAVYAHVASQVDDLVIAQRLAEVLSGDIFNLMRFVKDHGCVFRQDGAEVLFLHRKVGKEEVVVDDDDVAFGGTLPHQREKAAVKLLALLSSAKVAARVELRPDRAVFRQCPDLAAVAGFGGLLPIADDFEIHHLFKTVENGLLLAVVELLAAEVVLAPFHVAHAQRFGEVLLQKGDVLEVELLLQVLGAGGDHHALAGEDGGQQIRQRLAGAGAGFNNEVLAVDEGIFHGFGHLELPRAKLEIGMHARKHAVSREVLAGGALAGLRGHGADGKAGTPAPGAPSA
jgi:hypothetical protein